MDQTRLPEAVRTAIAAKCGTIVSHSLSWESASRKALVSGASAEAVVGALSGMRSSRNFEALLAGLAREGQGLDPFLRNFRGLVDESSFDLASWFGALEAVQAYLLESSRSASPSSIVGYIKCTADFGEGVENHDSLPVLVHGMLETYGFEGQQGCGTDRLG